MKGLLIVSFILVVLLVIGLYINQFIVVGLVIFSGFFLPVFLIEAIALVWLFKDFSALRAIYTALVLYIVSISVSIFIYTYPVKFIKLYIEPDIAVGAISLMLHLFLLKLLFKASLSIRVVSAFAFAHIVYVICYYIFEYWLALNRTPVTYC